MFKFCIFKKYILIPPMVLISFLLSNTFTFAGDKDISMFNDDHFVDSLFINQGKLGEFGEHAFIGDKSYLGINGEYVADLLSSNQNSQDGPEANVVDINNGSANRKT